MVVMCTRGNWESHHLDIAMSAVLGIHKHPQDQLIPKIDCFKLKQALTVIPWTVNSTFYSLYLWRKQSVFRISLTTHTIHVNVNYQTLSCTVYHLLSCAWIMVLLLSIGNQLEKTLGNFTKWSKKVSGGLGQRIILWKFTRHKFPSKLHIMFSETYY